MGKIVKSTLLLVSGGFFLFALKRKKSTAAANGKGSPERAFTGSGVLFKEEPERFAREFISTDFFSVKSESPGRNYSFLKRNKESEGELSGYLPPDGEVFLGSFYQVKDGDSPQEVCMKALFGPDEIRFSEPWAEDAACELWQRIQSSPFNLSCYKSKKPVERKFFERKGIASLDSIFFDRVYEDNFLRMNHGFAPSGGEGESLPLLWIPMINADVFEREKKVTTEGVFHDSDCGGSAIDPPAGLFSPGVEQSRTSYDVNL